MKFPIYDNLYNCSWIAFQNKKIPIYYEYACFAGVLPYCRNPKGRMSFGRGLLTETLKVESYFKVPTKACSNCFNMSNHY